MTRPRILVLGSDGQVGFQIMRTLAPLGEITGSRLDGAAGLKIDITDHAGLERVLLALRPKLIVNAVAYTAVDRAEEEPRLATAINATAVGVLGAIAARIGAAVVHYSTDYVYSGVTDRPWREDDLASPVNVYGRSKLAGERAAELARRHLIVRTAWLFGEGANFVASIRRQLDAGTKTLRVVNDQRGCPTYTVDLAEALLRLLESGTMGVIHAVNAGSATWFEFAQEILRLLGSDAEVVPISTAEAARPAPRPACSVLDTSELRRILGSDLPPWQDALTRYLRKTGGESSPA
jgi:dTDP-4-dehydrorhamnose reductase